MDNYGGHMYAVVLPNFRTLYQYNGKHITPVHQLRIMNGD
ncbi:hypothetical protein ECEC1846_5595 [Escherichia coli EC1846]|uniref:Uncharacterized protein n=3 Tax=Escherichia coli TaxID=562 RepID=A0A0H3PVM0_ECO5C|nr:hypothetical protein ECH74115_5804 [Escherichia coli O157:H7 str. EC4115]EDU34085.1 hypothetical protein ECH7EC4196_1042 [Escherichia coli O157:H7 str. EC4196]EDU54324.1 hypothetical protein ECH7EC4113_5522 [Escherichia coli O157:H7 str. EC4113]EDU68788.1 hypothetical protein ECH7EC4076_2457 [Escherichia coli O157:H7 str. EC4076]EDU76328.1 hypothetical protein ECH7EC4401_4290 [Escherichia coli O157:H7 str. EC4401]EDU82326.1 hypothetical protein ECH7EC4486_2015 [Escherichia coli O157:H7 str.